MSIIFMCIKQKSDFPYFWSILCEFPDLCCYPDPFHEAAPDPPNQDSQHRILLLHITHSGQCVLPYVRDQE